MLFGRRVNLDVPGHVRPGYRADELVGRLREAGFQVTSHQYTYGPIETFTNNISYLITGAPHRRKLQNAAVFPPLPPPSYPGRCSRPLRGSALLAAAHHPAPPPPPPPHPPPPPPP